MEKEYRKTINKPEGRHRYWHIIKEDRDFFPDAHEIFKLKFHDRVFSLQVNHKDDIMTGQLYEKYRFLEGDRITVTKKKDLSYVLEAPDTELYPNVD